MPTLNLPLNASGAPNGTPCLSALGVGSLFLDFLATGGLIDLGGDGPLPGDLHFSHQEPETVAGWLWFPFCHNSSRGKITHK